jgi:hypothetical protein
MFFVSVIACWRIVLLITTEYGPFDFLKRLRTFANKHNWKWIDLDCPYCMSVWVAMPFGLYLANDFWEFIIFWFGVAGGAILIHLIHERLDF